MQSMISRWFMFALLFGWAMTHASVFGQPAGKTSEPKSPASPIAKLRAGLDKNITIDFSGQSLNDVLNHFRDKTGLAINLDQTAMMQMGIGIDDGGGVPAAPVQFQLKATNEKASQVLRKLLNTYQLTYVIFEDALLITTEEAAVMRQFRQRVSVDLEEVPFKKAVRELAKNHGLNLVIDPSVMKDSETPISLQLENAGIETTIRLLSELAKLKAVRMGNVLFITHETKAKKIRDEEPQQFDNMPSPTPVRGFGGGFGGIAMPGRALAVPQILPPNALPAIPPALPDPAGDAPPPPKRPNAVPQAEPAKLVPLVPGDAGLVPTPPALQRQRAVPVEPAAPTNRDTVK